MEWKTQLIEKTKRSRQTSPANQQTDSLYGHHLHHALPAGDTLCGSGQWLSIYVLFKNLSCSISFRRKECLAMTFSYKSIKTAYNKADVFYNYISTLIDN